MALVDRVLVAALAGVGTLGMAVVTIAQGVLDPTALTIERFVGGGVLLVAAWFITRWAWRLVQEMRGMLDAERAAWQRDRLLLVEERDKLRKELIETHGLLRDERSLRISLERAGLIDRREPPTE